MTLEILSTAIGGALVLGYSLVALFFVRFWKKTADRLFLIFAAAFAMLMIERLLLLFSDPQHEGRPYIYAVRLIAFLLILIAIIDKNRHGDIRS